MVGGRIVTEEDSPVPTACVPADLFYTTRLGAMRSEDLRSKDSIF